MIRDYLKNIFLRKTEMHVTVWLSLCNTQLENNVTPASLILSKVPNIYLVLEKHLHSVKTPSVLTDLCFYLHTHTHTPYFVTSSKLEHASV